MAMNALLMRPQAFTDSSPAMEVDVSVARLNLLPAADDVDQAIRNMLWRGDDLADELLKFLA